MVATAPQITTDPLGVFVASAFARDARSVPLVSTNFDVSIEAGLATVATKRLFRNDEQNSIEATITFPIPVQATLFDLEARIDGRVVKARAQRRAQARETYEDAIERGKPAVLHEEVLRGVHMLSVGHIPPAATVEVSTIWAMPLTNADGKGRLRIPLTVGDIYGRSNLPDSDDLIHGGPSQTAELTVRCGDGSVELVGGKLDEGHAKVGLNAPIDLVIADWVPRDLQGKAADGREVLLRIEPREAGDAALDVAVLVDHSGSMGTVCAGGGRQITKHQAVIEGLMSITDRVGDLDLIDLWQFDDSVNHIGSTRASSTKPGLPGLPREKFAILVNGLSGPAGGTEIGGALARVVGQSSARDILLVTDGKSYALDIQALAQTGRRFSVVLVGEDSLEANVGHLAALTGGDIFIVPDDVTTETMAAALGALRRPSEMPPRITGDLQRVKLSRGNAILSAEWRLPVEPSGDSVSARSVAAVAASLALPALGLEAATCLAEAEGLVTHLTSLVLVDEASDLQEGLPATRKIALPTPRTVSRTTVAARAMPRKESYQDAGDVAYSILPSAPTDFDDYLMADAPAEAAGLPLLDLSAVGLQIDWDLSPDRLVSGDLSAIDPRTAWWIERVAERAEVVALARQLGVDAVALVVALIARSHASASRSAARIAKRILGTQATAEIEAVSLALGLGNPNAGSRRTTKK